MWCKHDKGRMQQVRTAYGLSEGIHPQAGAFGQGAVESPMGFVSLMSWKCDFIEQKCPDKDPYVYDSGSHENLKITKSIYCEDATYFSRSLKGSQALSTAVGIFGAASGMELNVKKSFWVSLYGTHEAGAKLTIPCPEIDSEHRSMSSEWKFKKIESQIIKEVKSDERWRHLGNFQDNKNSSKFTVAEVKCDVKEVVGYMCRRNITPEGTLQGYKMKCLPRIMYKLKHSNLNEKQTCDIQTKINTRMKPKLNVSKTIPDMLLHGHRLGGGVEVPHLWDETNKEKMIVFLNLLSKTKKDVYPIVVGAIHRLQKWNGLSPRFLCSAKIKLIRQDDNAWLASLWAYNACHNLAVGIPDIPAMQELEEGDDFIMDLYVDYIIDSFTEEEKECWKWWVYELKYGAQTAPPALLKMKYKKVNNMASKLRMLKVQRVSHLFNADDISGTSVSNMKMRIKAEFNCKNALNERGKNELIAAGIVSERLTMPVLEYSPYETSLRPPDEIEMLEESGVWDKITGAKIGKRVLSSVKLRLSLTYTLMGS